MSQLRLIGRALAAPFLRLGSGYNSIAQRFPQATALGTTVLKTSAADAFAQLVMERREQLDLKRHAMFCMFGFAYLGVWQYYLYNVLFVRWCKSITKVVGHVGSAPVKTFLDQAIHHPFLYFPSFYIVKGCMQQRAPSESLKLCYEDMWENLKALWAVWVPAQLINFSIVPMHLRIPFVAGVSFLWTVIISNLRGQMDEPPSQPVPLSDSSDNQSMQPASTMPTEQPEGQYVLSVR